MKFLLLFLFSFNVFAFDHTHKLWNDILETKTKEVRGQILVDYPSLKMDDEVLKEYLSGLEAVKKDEFDKFTNDQKLSFWINAYNAYTVKLIVENYPLKSIKDLGGIFSTPWKKEFIPLFSRKMSLDDIEHKTIRENFKEPRIHFVVNCASISCPSLLREAIRADKLETQLEKATKHFLRNNNKNYYKASENTLYLSKIFDWYQEDFDKHSEGVLKFVKKYLKVNSSEKPKFRYLDYDWSLNRY